MSRRPVDGARLLPRRALAVTATASEELAPDFEAWLSGYVEAVLRLEGIAPTPLTEQDSAA